MGGLIRHGLSGQQPVPAKEYGVLKQLLHRIFSNKRMAEVQVNVVEGKQDFCKSATLH